MNEEESDKQRLCQGRGRGEGDFDQWSGKSSLLSWHLSREFSEGI